MASSPAPSTSSAAKALSATARSIAAAPATAAKSRTGRNLVGAVGGQPDAEHTGAAIDDLFELRLAVKVEPHRDTKAVAQRIGKKASARGRADQRERRKIDFHRACRRSFADDQIELKILHGGIEDFLDRGIESMNFVDEQDVARFEIG